MTPQLPQAIDQIAMITLSGNPRMSRAIYDGSGIETERNELVVDPLQDWPGQWRSHGGPSLSTRSPSIVRCRLLFGLHLNFDRQ